MNTHNMFSWKNRKNIYLIPFLSRGMIVILIKLLVKLEQTLGVYTVFSDVLTEYLGLNDIYFLDGKTQLYELS